MSTPSHTEIFKGMSYIVFRNRFWYGFMFVYIYIYICMYIYICQDGGAVGFVDFTKLKPGQDVFEKKQPEKEQVR